MSHVNLRKTSIKRKHFRYYWEKPNFPATTSSIFRTKFLKIKKISNNLVKTTYEIETKQPHTEHLHNTANNQCKQVAKPTKRKRENASSWSWFFAPAVLPKWKDQQIRSTANDSMDHAMIRLGEASHCRQTCKVVNVWKSLLHLESSLIGLPLNNLFCLHCWKEIY